MHARGRLAPLLFQPSAMPFASSSSSSRKRGLSGTAAAAAPAAGGEDAYLENWQKQRIRESPFYEAEGKARRWMYTVDLQGRLFLEDMRKKDLTSCLKNDKFLDFFFSRVRKNDTGRHPEYPFVSPCGREMNYILPADMPVVFHDLVMVERRDPSHSGWELRYGGTLAQPFDPAAVVISHRTGRLYHRLDWKEKEEEKGAGVVRPRFGLLRSSVGLALSDKIEYEWEGEAAVLEWPGPTEGQTRRLPIKALPPDEEPVWGLPPMPDD